MDKFIQFLLKYVTPEQLLFGTFVALIALTFGMLFWSIYNIVKQHKKNKIFRENLKVGDTCIFGKVVEINREKNLVKVEKTLNLSDIYKI